MADSQHRSDQEKARWQYREADLYGAGVLVLTQLKMCKEVGSSLPFLRCRTCARASGDSNPEASLAESMIEAIKGLHGVKSEL